jgi:hypothetical protein
MALREVTADFSFLRLIDISGGLTPDPDWVLTNDIAGWRAGSDPKWWKPTYDKPLGGRTQFMLLFYNDASTIVPAPGNTRVDIDLVEKVVVEQNVVASRLVTRGGQKQIPGDVILEEESALSFPGEIGARIAASQNLPVATFLAILARIV